jgi:hypothetical protein
MSYANARRNFAQRVSRGICDAGKLVWINILGRGYYTAQRILDLATVRDRSTPENPHQYREGVEYVFVNGQLVVREKQSDLGSSWPRFGASQIGTVGLRKRQE